MFTSDTLSAAQKLKKHILSGCLCNIPPGGGTNRNERLHCTLNGLFTWCKLGVLLAYALLTISIHAHNTSERINGRVFSKPVTMMDAHHSPVTRYKLVGVQPKVHQDHSSTESEHWERDVSENVMDMEKVVPLFIKSMQKHSIMNAMQAMGLHNLKRATLYFIEYSSQPECSASEACLSEKLSELGLQMQHTPPDGNCFFTAVALKLLSNMQRWNHSLSLIGAKADMRECQVATLLRNNYVKELLGERHSDYEAFVSHCDFDYNEEAKKFYESGYDTELGNTMPLAMANLLQCPIIIFTKDNTKQTYYIIPETLTTEATILLIHTPLGPGHYDAALPCCSSGRARKEVHSCRCGVNKRDSTKIPAIQTSVCHKMFMF